MNEGGVRVSFKKVSKGGGGGGTGGIWILKGGHDG